MVFSHLYKIDAAVGDEFVDAGATNLSVALPLDRVLNFFHSLKVTRVRRGRWLR